MRDMRLCSFGYYHCMETTYWAILRGLTIAFEVAGLAILLSSGVLALLKWFKIGIPQFLRGEKGVEEDLRVEFGHRIVLALEFFISADIIRSIQTPSFQELGRLGAIVVIRTVLHYSLR